MSIFSIETWICLQLLIDVFIISLILYLIQTQKKEIKNSDQNQKVLGEVTGILEPFMKEARSLAQTFDTQLQEKQKHIQLLTKNLDDQIISLNFYLGRLKTKTAGVQSEFREQVEQVEQLEQESGHDQQKEILKLHQKGLSSEQIAKDLSLPKGEVELVIELKKNFQ